MGSHKSDEFNKNPPEENEHINEIKGGHSCSCIALALKRNEEKEECDESIATRTSCPTMMDARNKRPKKEPDASARAKNDEEIIYPEDFVCRATSHPAKRGGVNRKLRELFDANIYPETQTLAAAIRRKQSCGACWNKCACNCADVRMRESMRHEDDDQIKRALLERKEKEGPRERSCCRTTCKKSVATSSDVKNVCKNSSKGPWKQIYPQKSAIQKSTLSPIKLVIQKHLKPSFVKPELSTTDNPTPARRFSNEVTTIPDFASFFAQQRLGNPLGMFSSIQIKSSMRENKSLTSLASHKIGAFETQSLMSSAIKSSSSATSDMINRKRNECPKLCTKESPCINDSFESLEQEAIPLSVTKSSTGSTSKIPACYCTPPPLCTKKCPSTRNVGVSCSKTIGCKEKCTITIGKFNCCRCVQTTTKKFDCKEIGINPIPEVCNTIDQDKFLKLFDSCYLYSKRLANGLKDIDHAICHKNKKADDENDSGSEVKLMSSKYCCATKKQNYERAERKTIILKAAGTSVEKRVGKSYQCSKKCRKNLRPQMDLNFCPAACSVAKKSKKSINCSVSNSQKQYKTGCLLKPLVKCTKNNCPHYLNRLNSSYFSSVGSMTNNINLKASPEVAANNCIYCTSRKVVKKMVAKKKPNVEPE